MLDYSLVGSSQASPKHDGQEGTMSMFVLFVFEKDA